MKALIIKKHGVAAVADIKEQSMRPGYIKVKTVAVALNPTDAHHAASEGRVGGILGCDLSGVVEEVGEECKTDVRKGDKVYGVSHGGNLNGDEDGAFAEYCMVRDGHVGIIPEHMSFEETATLGVGLTTVGQTLYMTLGLPLPGEKPLEGETFILIYGGSTATGTLAIQFAKLSGLTVITTASPGNFDMLKSRGADFILNYHDADIAQQIRNITKDSLHHVLDCIATEESYKIVAEALPAKSDKPMQVVSLLPTDTWPREDVKITAVLAYTTMGEAFTKFGMDVPAMPAHFEFGVKFWKLASELLAAGRIKVHPVALRKGGLGGIPSGLAEHANGEVKAVKLVYKVADADGPESQGDAAIKWKELGSKW